jgi:hypothetical protein
MSYGLRAQGPGNISISNGPGPGTNQAKPVGWHIIDCIGNDDGSDGDEDGGDADNAGRIKVGGSWFHSPCLYAERALKKTAKQLDHAHDRKGKETPHADTLNKLRKNNKVEYRRRVASE